MTPDKKRTLGRDFVVGLIFMLAMVLLAVFTIFLKRDLLLKDTYPKQADFSNINGLVRGDKVMLRGLQVGRVGDLQPTADSSHIRVQLDLDSELAFREGYLVEIRSASALGGQWVYLELGDAEAAAVPQDLVLEGRSAAGPLGELSRKLDGIVTKVDEVVSDFKNEKGTLYRLIYEDELYTQTQSTFKEAEDGFKALNDAGVKVGEAMDELKKAGAAVDKSLAEFGELKANFSTAADSITKAGDSLTQAGKSVDEVATNMNGAITDAREGKGTVGKLLTDDQLYTDAKATMKDLREGFGTFRKSLDELSAKLSNENSTFSKVLTDEGKLYSTVEGAFSSMDDTMTEVNGLVLEVKEGNGTLGRLIKDDSLYRETESTVKEVRGAVSDLREQSPIQTFGTFIFGAL